MEFCSAMRKTRGIKSGMDHCKWYTHEPSDGDLVGLRPESLNWANLLIALVRNQRTAAFKFYGRARVGVVEVKGYA